MAVRIRLKRTGRKNRPYYRICVFDSRTARDGKPVEEIGSYDPRAGSMAEGVKLDAVRAHYWVGVGAQPSETVGAFLKHFGVRKGAPLPEAQAESAGEAQGDAASATTAG